MQIERWTITDRAEWLARRKTNINGSEIGALFGCSPFLTPFALYAHKAGIVDLPDNDNAAMKRGRILEPAIAEALREERPDWTIRKCTDYFWSRECGLGCTPDFEVTCPERGEGTVQGKTVAKQYFEEHWQEGPPEWIILQTLQEMMFRQTRWGGVAALVLSNFDVDLKFYPFERYAPAEQRIIDAAGRFWTDVSVRREPPINYGLDGEIIKAMYPEDSGETIDLTGDNRMPELLDLRERLSKQKNGAEKDLKAVTAEIAAKMGDATFAIVPGWKKITFKKQTRKGYTVEDTSFRVLRATRAAPERDAT